METTRVVGSNPDALPRRSLFLVPGSDTSGPMERSHNPLEGKLPSGWRAASSQSLAPTPGKSKPRIASSEIVVPKQLTPETRQRLTEALYEVHCQVFDGVEKEVFSRYVVNSKAEHTWIQIHKNHAGEIVGYLALHIFERELEGRTCAVLRGEAGTMRAYRGGNASTRFFLEQALRYRLAHPRRPLYYLGSLVHPSSYLLFARNTDFTWPNHRQPVPPELLAFMSGLADDFGLERVDANNPLVRKVGWKTRDSEVEHNYWRYHCEKQEVRFFLEANPGYGEGHGLVTLLPLSARALSQAVCRIGLDRLRRISDAVISLLHRLPIGSSLLRPASVRRRLKASPLFSSFDDDTLRAITAAAEVLTLPAGRFIFHQGDASDDLYLVARGASYVLSEQQGREKILDEVGGGALLGEIAMLSGDRRSASIRTATASTLVRIGRKALFPLLELDSSLSQALWSAFAARRFDDHARDLGRFSHLGRLGRQQWILSGEQRVLAEKERVSFGPETAYVFAATGAVEIEQGGSWLVTRSPTLVEVKGSLQLVAQVPSRIVCIPAEVPLNAPLTSAA